MSFRLMPSPSSSFPFPHPSRSICGRGCLGVCLSFRWNWVKSSFSGCRSQVAPLKESKVLAAQISVPSMSRELSLLPFCCGGARPREKGQLLSSRSPWSAAHSSVKPFMGGPPLSASSYE